MTAQTDVRPPLAKTEALTDLHIAAGDDTTVTDTTVTTTILTDDTMTSSAARALTDRIKTAVEVAWQMIVEAYTSRAWSALGYASWDDYCLREFGTSRIAIPREDRTESVLSLRSAGLSIRAIRSATGLAKDTITNELKVSQSGTPSRGSHPAGLEPPLVCNSGTGEILAERDADGRMIDVRTGGEIIEYAPKVIGPFVREGNEVTAFGVTLTYPEPATASPSNITGTDGKKYTVPSSGPGQSPARRKPLPDVARSAGYEARKAMQRIERVVSDDRFAANESMVTTALYGHLQYIADTANALLDQLHLEAR